MKCVIIVDPIGIHSGMRYYYNSFKKLFENDTDVCFEIASNYNEGEKTPFLPNFYEGSSILKILKLLWAGIKLFFYSLAHRTPVYVYLSYGTIIDAFLLFSLSFSRNLVVDCHEVIQQGSEDNLFLNKVFRLVYKRFHKVIIHSEHGVNMLNKIQFKGDYYQVPHFRYVEDDSYNKLNVGIDVTNSIDRDFVNLLFFGNITYNKGVDLLIESIMKSPESLKRCLRVIIAGRAIDDTIHKYDDILTNSSVFKVVIRHLNDDEMKFLYVNSDYVVLPYRITYQSGVLEMAFNYRKPIITSPIPYFQSTIDKYPSFGLIADFNDQTIINTYHKICNNKNVFFCESDLDNYYHQDVMYRFHDWLYKHINDLVG